MRRRSDSTDDRWFAASRILFFFAEGFFLGAATMGILRLVLSLFGVGAITVEITIATVSAMVMNGFIGKAAHRNKFTPFMRRDDLSIISHLIGLDVGLVILGVVYGVPLLIVILLPLAMTAIGCYIMLAAMKRRHWE